MRNLLTIPLMLAASIIAMSAPALAATIIYPAISSVPADPYQPPATGGFNRPDGPHNGCKFISEVLSDGACVTFTLVGSEPTPSSLVNTCNVTYQISDGSTQTRRELC